jgi:hypothetical protein
MVAKLPLVLKVGKRVVKSLPFRIRWIYVWNPRIAEERAHLRTAQSVSRVSESFRNRRQVLGIERWYVSDASVESAGSSFAAARCRRSLAHERIRRPVDRIGARESFTI